MDAEAKPEVVSKKLNKNQKRKLKKKLRKQHLPTEIPVIKTPVKAATATLAQKSDVDVQYVSEDITCGMRGAMFFVKMIFSLKANSI